MKETNRCREECRIGVIPATCTFLAGNWGKALRNSSVQSLVAIEKLKVFLISRENYPSPQKACIASALGDIILELGKE